MKLNKIKLVSDSTCDLSQEWIQRYDITIVPLYVNFGEESYFDGVNLSTEDMYKLVEQKKQLPKTAAASPGSFFEVFEKWSQQGYEIIYVGIGSKFSATFLSATTAKQMLEEANIHLIDSSNLSSGSGLLMLKAGSLREQGFSATEIVQALQRMVPLVRSQFVIDTLEYLYKGGRLNALSAVMGSVLKIKPIIKVRDGVMAVGKKGRGSVKHGLSIMLDEILEQAALIDPEFVMITHSLADASVPYVENILRENLSVKHLIETHAGCVISSHCGKGTIGVLYILKEDEALSQ